MTKEDAGLEVFELFQMTPDFVCIATKEGYFKKVNPAVINKLGYTEEELFSRPISSFIYPDDKALTSSTRSQLLKGTTLINFQNRYIKKDGTLIWLEWSSIYSPDKELVFAIAKDISERKKMDLEIEEKYKKFKSLATHFKNSIEKERKHLSTELHEELAQLASVIKIDIDWINTHVTNMEVSPKNRIAHALAITDLLINTIRRISFSISPNMLSDFGLTATLAWQCGEFSILNGIPCTFHSNYDEASLTDEIKLDFFRICQESLTNIMYHAAANNVTIRIDDMEDKIELTISDDGKGFNVAEMKNRSGLINMRERAASINGKLMIESEIGKGTIIYVSIKR